MRFKKILSMTLILCMLMGLFPMSVQAADSTAASESVGDLFLDKTAILENDGTCTIQLEAYATGTPVKTQVKEGKALQIVIVIDQSGSTLVDGYLDNVKTAVKEFVEVVAANGRSFEVEHQIAIVGFASNGSDGGSTLSGYDFGVAGGSESEWVNTGVFDSEGNFQNYASGDAVYTEYDGELNLNDSYYVKLSDGTYSEIMYQEVMYHEVANPNTSRKDLYAILNGKYVPVEYMTYEGYVKLADNSSMVQGNTYYIDGESNGEKETINYGDCYSKTTYNPRTSSWGGSGDLYETGDEIYVLDEDGTLIKLTCTRSGWFLDYEYTWKTEEGTTWSLKSGDAIYKSTTGWYSPSTNILVNINDSTDIYEWKESTGWFHTNENEDKIDIPSTQVLYEKEKGQFWTYTDENKSMVQVSNETLHTREGGELEGVDYRDALVPVTDGENGTGDIRESILTSIDKINSSGATRTSYGMEMADKIFQSNHSGEADHGHVVVAFTDGSPGYDGFDETEANSSLASAYDIKNTYDGEIYTVGLYDEKLDTDNTTLFMKGLSSNYKSVQSMDDISSTTADADKYYQTTSDMTRLNDIFTNITTESTTTSTKVTLTAKSILRDIMGTGMELVAGSSISAKKVSGTWDTSQVDNIKWGTAVELETVTIDDTDTFSNAEDSMIKIFNLGANKENVGTYHPHTIDVNGFDYQAEYISEGHDGSKLLVTITGVEASPYAVWNQVMFTNNDYSGIWTPQTETQDRELKASFVQPTTLLTSTNYVVDYAKPFTMDVAADLGMSAITHLDGDDTNKFSEAKTTISDKFGSISKIGTTTLQYTPKNMNWDEVESFYVFGKTENEFILTQTANEVYSNLWSRVNVIPANNVYYEDTFVTEETGTVGIEYSGNWTTDGSAPGNTETVNGSVHGWEEALSDDTGYSDGSAHKSDTVGATATFTFTGTGVDIYSRTDMKTGIVMAMLVEGDSMTQQGANGNTVNKPVKKLLMVDCLGASEEGNPYYQIPTLSFEDLNYGTYTVKIVVSRAISRDPETNEVIESTARSTYYLDGIRVYNPVDITNSFVQDAYGEEINATYAEVRDSLLAAGDFGSGDGVSGAVYVDEDGDGKIDEDTSDTGTFEVFGSKNEVYLKKGQMIAFSVNYDENARYFVGLKSVEGAALDVNITGEAKKIAHSTDLYYEVSKEQLAENGGIITIMNNGEKVLAVTKLRLTNVSQTASASLFSLRPEAELAAYARSLDMSEPEEPTTPEVDIENPEITEERDPELDSVVDKLFTDIYSWF